MYNFRVVLNIIFFLGFYPAIVYLHRVASWQAGNYTASGSYNQATSFLINSKANAKNYGISFARLSALNLTLLLNQKSTFEGERMKQANPQ